MNMPTWQRELENFIGIKPLFVLEGNVSDLYPWHCEGQTQFLPLAHILPELFAAPDGTRPYRFLYVDPLRGVHDPLGTGEVRALAQAAQREAERLTAEADALNPGADPASRQQPFAANRLIHDSLLVRAALSRRLGEEEPRSVACVFDFASRLASSPEDLTPEENAMFMNLLLGAKDAIRGDGEHVNTLVLVANKATDLPSWLVRGNPDVRVIALPSPDRPAREAYLDIAFPDLAAPELDRPREKLVDTTDRMLLTELDELRRLYARGGTAPEHVTELVDLYKYGIRENRWSAMMAKLRDDPAAALRRTDLPKLSLGTKTAATLLAIVAAVVLPQLFHVIGAVSGQGTMLGVAFLPMHLPIIFVGLIAGPAVGAIAGAAAPLVSFLLSGMPMLAMLPLMMAELCAYGLVAGLLRGIKLPSLAKVVIAQLAGRVVLTAATAIAVFAFGSSKAIAATWTSDLAAGLPGLALQWALIPLAAYWTESLIAKRNH